MFEISHRLWKLHQLLPCNSTYLGQSEIKYTYTICDNVNVDTRQFWLVALCKLYNATSTGCVCDFADTRLKYVAPKLPIGC